MCCPGYRIIVFVYVFVCVYAHARLGRPTSSLTDPWRGMWFCWTRVDIGVVCTKRFESGWLFPHLCLISWNWLLKGERACFSNNSKYCTHTCMDSYKLTEPINRKCGSEVDMWRNFLCVCSWSLKHGNPWSYERIAFHWSKSYVGKHLVHLNSVQSYPKPFFVFF